jgi:hypothetical protein
MKNYYCSYVEKEVSLNEKDECQETFGNSGQGSCPLKNSFSCPLTKRSFNKK